MRGVSQAKFTPITAMAKAARRPVRYVAAMAAAAGMAVALLPGSANAVPMFNGDAEALITINSFGGSVIDKTAQAFGTGASDDFPIDNATSGASGRPDIDDRTIELRAEANGIAGSSFARAAAFAAGGLVLQQSELGGSTVGLTVENLTPTLTAEMGGFVIMDFLVAFVIGDVPSVSDLGTFETLVEFSGLFTPSELLFSCTASNLNPTGCDDAALLDGFPIEAGVEGTLFAVLALQGATRGGPPVAVPTPSAIGLLGLAVIGLGLATRRRPAA